MNECTESGKKGYVDKNANDKIRKIRKFVCARNVNDMLWKERIQRKEEEKEI